SSSVSTLVSLFSALATAERTSFSRSFATVLLVKRRMLRASSTFLPRTRSTTRRTFCGEALRYFNVAVASISILLLGCRCGGGRSRTGRLGALLDLLAAVALERARERELAELVPDHVLGDVDRHELAAVVHRERMADHLRRDGGAARPGLDDLLVALAVHRLDLVHEVVVDEGALLD